MNKWRKRALKYLDLAEGMAVQADRFERYFDGTHDDLLKAVCGRDALLAWQRRVRERWERVFLASVTLETQPTVTMCKDSWAALRRAIEDAPVEPKEET